MCRHYNQCTELVPLIDAACFVSPSILTRHPAAHLPLSFSSANFTAHAPCVACVLLHPMSLFVSLPASHHNELPIAASFDPQSLQASCMH